MSGELKNDPLTVVGGGGGGGYSKDSCGICTEDDEGSTEGREEHDDGGNSRLGIWIRLNGPGLNDFPQPQSHSVLSDESNGLCGAKPTKYGLANLIPNPHRYPVTSDLWPIMIVQGSWANVRPGGLNDSQPCAWALMGRFALDVHVLGMRHSPP